MIEDPLTHDETTLTEDLASIPREAGVAFAAACARRLTAASQANGIDVTLVLSAVDRLREFAVGRDIGDVAELEAKLIAIMPDEDDCADLPDFVYGDAIASTVYTLLYASGGDVQNAVWAARRAYEAVDLCAGRTVEGTVFTPDVEAATLGHPWVQSELRRQRRDLQSLLVKPDDVQSRQSLIDRAAHEPVAR
jgi:hypothetical protein